MKLKKRYVLGQGQLVFCYPYVYGEADGVGVSINSKSIPLKLPPEKEFEVMTGSEAPQFRIIIELVK